MKYKKYIELERDAPVFSKRLALLLNRHGLTQSDLANMIGVSEGAVSGWLKGAEPRINLFNEIANKLNVSADYLLGNTDIETPNIGLQAIHKKTGLSEESIKSICSWNQKKDEYFSYSNYLDFINTMLESPAFFNSLVNNYQNYLFSKELCRLIEFENPDIDFSTKHSGMPIFTTEVSQEEYQKAHDKAERERVAKGEYFEEIDNTQPLQLFKIQKTFMKFIEAYASAEIGNINSRQEIEEKWCKKKAELDMITKSIEDLEEFIKRVKEKFKK